MFAVEPNMHLLVTFFVFSVLIRRLTKENVKIHGRQIGKLSHNNPIIVCDYVRNHFYREKLLENSFLAPKYFPHPQNKILGLFRGIYLFI